MKKIKLTQGKVALVDDEDYEYLMQWKWWAHKMGNGFYAERKSRKGEFLKQKTIFMHRVVAERAGIDISNMIDHIDRDGLNNQRENLRAATHKTNGENRNAKGYYWNKQNKKWKATITHNQKSIHLGLFGTEEEAKQARLEAERKYFTHARRNGEDT